MTSTARSGVAHAWRRDVRAAMPGWLLARVVVLAALAVNVVIRHRSPPVGYGQYYARAGLLGWDAAWYRRIAVHGYLGVPREGIRFFPLWPALARVLGGPSWWGVGIALVVVANALAVVAGAATHRLMLELSGDAATAKRAATLLAIAPPAYVLVMGYAEPLALTLTAVTFLALRRRRWWLAGAGAALAALTRPTGVLLAVPIAICATEQLWRARRSPDRGVNLVRTCGPHLAAVAAPVLALGAFLLWCQVRLGDALAPMHEQNTAGLRGAFVLPPVTVVRSANLLVHLQGGKGLHAVTVVVGVLLVLVAARRLPLEYSAYAAVTVAVAVAATNLGSSERYVWGAFVPVLAVADITRTRRAWHVVAVLSLGLLFYLAMRAFTGTTVP